MADRIRTLLLDTEKCMDMGKAAKDFALQYGFINVKKELEQIYFD